MKSLKKYGVILVLGLLLMFAAAQTPSAFSAELTNQEQKALVFLRDVIGLDMTKYDVEPPPRPPDHLPPPPGLDVLGAMGWVKFTLTSAGSKIDVFCSFRDNTVWCRLYVIEGSPLFAEPSTNILDAAKGLIRRYQTYSGAPHLKAMRETLDAVNEIENIESRAISITSGNVKLKIFTTPHQPITYFMWVYTANGVDADKKTVSFYFHRDGGYLVLFLDCWNLYKIGSTNVKVSKDEAIRIAKEHAQKYTYTVEDVPVGNFTILDEPVFAELSMEDGGNYTLYPHWHIRLALDKMYPGGVTGLQVMLWAHTGEVTRIAPIGSLGVPPDGGSPTVPPTEPPPEDSTVSSTEPSPKPGFLGTSLPMEYGYAIVAVTVVAIAAATGYLYLKRKK